MPLAHQSIRVICKVALTGAVLDVRDLPTIVVGVIDLRRLIAVADAQKPHAVASVALSTLCVVIRDHHRIRVFTGQGFGGETSAGCVGVAGAGVGGIEFLLEQARCIVDPLGGGGSGLAGAGAGIKFLPGGEGKGSAGVIIAPGLRIGVVTILQNQPTEWIEVAGAGGITRMSGGLALASVAEEVVTDAGGLRASLGIGRIRIRQGLAG